MAETTVFPVNTTETETKPPKSGRPKAAEGAPQGKVPAGGPAFMPPDDFFSAVSGITADQWPFRMIYGYRLAPITDRRSSGQPFYLAKYSGPIDQDQVMRDFGSGMYRFLLNETPPGGGKSQTIARCDLSIMNFDYPPKVPAGEWVDDVRNRDWDWCRSKLGPQAAQGNGGTASDLAAAVTQVIRETRPETNDKEQTGLVTAFMEMARSNQALMSQVSDPKRGLEMIALLLPLLKPADKSGPDPLIQMLMEDRKAMREEMAEMRRARESHPNKSWLEVALENEEMMRRIFGKGNGPAGPQLDGWAAVIDKGIDKLGGAIAPVVPLIIQGVMQRQAQQNRTQAPAPTIVQTNPAPLPAPTEQPTPPAPEKTATAEGGPDVNQIALLQKYGQVISQALPFMVDRFKDYDSDKNPGVGYDCRDWFCTPQRFGNVVWEGLRTEIGIEQFVGIAKGIPQVWTAFQPEDKFRMFLTDFFTPLGEERAEYFEDDDFDDDPDEPPMTAAPGGGK